MPDEIWDEVAEILAEYYQEEPPQTSGVDMLRYFSTPTRLKKALRHIRGKWLDMAKEEEAYGLGEPEYYTQQAAKIDSLLRKLH